LADLQHACSTAATTLTPQIIASLIGTSVFAVCGRVSFPEAVTGNVMVETLGSIEHSLSFFSKVLTAIMPPKDKSKGKGKKKKAAASDQTEDAAEGGELLEIKVCVCVRNGASKIAEKIMQ
jgi:hypothetical protein